MDEGQHATVKAVTVQCVFTFLCADGVKPCLCCMSLAASVPGRKLSASAHMRLHIGIRPGASAIYPRQTSLAYRDHAIRHDFLPPAESL